jgi:preprotein translocase subunit SecA
MIVDQVLAKVFGTKNEREVKQMWPTVAAIGELEPATRQLSDAELAQKTIEFKERTAQGASLDDLLVEAFAVVREAGRRVLNMRHFDVQLMGGMVLHKGRIAEMKTGEGKTLVATLPCYLNALSGKGVHVVTVNDYLAKRDSEWMGRLYRFLGMKVGVIVHDLSDEERKEAYGADITYGTNNEFGFDYLRDNMKFRISDCVQREYNYAIVDEVDSILIDEARTPLIISGPSEESTDKYYKINRIIPKLVRGEEIKGKEPGESYTTGDYTIDEKHKSASLTEEGSLKVEKLLGLSNLWDPNNLEFNHHVQQALRAHVLYKRDQEYVVKDGDEGPEVIIVDEFTGRLMPGRRWSDGLHQAVEAKEGVKIQRENQTLATITFQNYFRMYKKLAGMTGTAETEAAEFQKTYNIDVVVIPTNRPMIRKENQDLVYRTEEEKFRNAAKEIKEFNAKGQPVLVGTISVEKSERLSGILKRMGVKHEVLNAKNHEREASIVAQAGRKNTVTVSTNMAGRGTDILLGGNAEFMTKDACLKQKIAQQIPESEAKYIADEHFYYFTHQDAFYRVPREKWDELFAAFKQQTDGEHEEVVALGGLHIVATERHESRRIDNQLRGRSGRQGDPGSSRFFLSLQDDLLRIFGGERMQNLMLRLGMEEDVPIESKLITKRIAKAQEAVEMQNFEARKHLLEYDDVNNKQRQAVYGMRRKLLEGADQKEHVMDMVQGIVDQFVEMRCPDDKHPDTWDLNTLRNDILTQFGARIDLQDISRMTRIELSDFLLQKLKEKYQEKEDLVGAEVMRQTERIVMLQVIDNQWKDHLLSMDELKQGIGLRGHGQKDPLVEYKRESYELFTAMMDRVEDESVRFLFFLQVHSGAGPILPYPEDDESGSGGMGVVPGGNGHGSGGLSPEEEAEAAAVAARAAEEEKKRAARRQMEDFTRNIERKKDKELAGLQFGGDDSTGPKTVQSGGKVGRNDPCPCGSGKKYKKCHGAAA